VGKKLKKKNKKRKKVQKVQREKSKLSLLRKQFNIGDSVVAKKGATDPDYGNDIGGWQGRIFEIDDDASKPLVCIKWDSITLKNMPHQLIERAAKDDLIWTEMCLYIDEIELTKPRDKQEEIPVTIENLKRELDLKEKYEIIEDLEDEIDYVEFEDQEERIQNILGVKNEEDMTVDDKNLKKYYNYLKANIDFSVPVTGIEDFRWEEYYVFGPGDQDEYKKLKKTRPSYTDKYKIIKIYDYNWEEGIIVKVKRISDNKKFTLPLADLESDDENSTNYQILDDYSVWFVNNR
jgi:hypothetical protein